ncbi:YciI family protein [Streptomyces sp. NPDC059582]|uniref:YciI family protein n=1 Tax=Streptomyces sp. NPDC059582 TaxID=3346875 RepID=UPI0036AF1AB7
MKYALFVCAPAGGEETGPGRLPGATWLRPAADATTVRAAGAEILLADGPFTDSAEYVTGLDIVEAADLDEAIALAAGHSAALGGGTVEVRPVWE